MDGGTVHRGGGRSHPGGKHRQDHGHIEGRIDEEHEQQLLPEQRRRDNRQEEQDEDIRRYLQRTARGRNTDTVDRGYHPLVTCHRRRLNVWRGEMKDSERYVEQVLGEISALRRTLESLPRGQVKTLVEVADLMAGSIGSGGTVLTCGNGGSAADAQHFATEIVGSFRGLPGAGRAIALTADSALLTAAAKVGINEIYKIGSVWAIAALAYGTDTIDKVDVIAGPGNIYVTLAKKILAGRVGIDMIAGPSEILIIADCSANPEFVAADLLSQAEHDPLASAIMITDSNSVARAVKKAIDRQVTELSRQDIAGSSLKNFGALLVVPDIATAVTIANKIAPEHLELLVDDPFAHIGGIRNAGALFLGPYTPEAVGDYIAGPNHVLPTAGTARFSSALSVSHFTKKTSLIHYSKTAFDRDARDIICLAKTEGLDAHANSIAIRTRK